MIHICADCKNFLTAKCRWCESNPYLTDNFEAKTLTGSFTPTGNTEDTTQ